ncbi:MAG: ATP-binding protein [Chromatiales bacterium]|jgi:signal transduction histidine kinase
MRALLFRLSLALLAVILLLGGGFFVVEQWSSRQYYDELTQRLNAPIAMYVTGERQLISAGRVDTDSLSTLGQQAMVVNPTVEVYLLGPDGAILGHTMPPETVLTDRVDLAPVRTLLDADSSMPIKGTDPRNPEVRKVFSASEVRSGDVLEGYLYAVLGGQKFDEIASDIRGSHVQRLTILAMAVVMAAAFLIGLLVFGLLTRRLTRLTADVQRFTASGFDPEAALSWKPRDGDEIDRLGSAFSVMSNTIREQIERLKENDRLRRELVSNVSHDLRTPLASMQGYVDTLIIKNGSLSADQRDHYLNITRKHAHRLGRLIGDLFELSRLDSASVEPQFERFSVAELLQDTSQEFELEASRAGVRLDVAAPRDGASVVADIGLIQRVLENLIRNALRFTPSGGRITLSVEERSSKLAVAVADTGVGIPENDLPRIFDRFYGNARESGAESSGLGLAIVKRILELHQSRITVTSAVDNGTRFEFELPASQAA